MYKALADVLLTKRKQRAKDMSDVLPTARKPCTKDTS